MSHKKELSVFPASGWRVIYYHVMDDGVGVFDTLHAIGFAYIQNDFGPDAEFRLLLADSRGEVVSLQKLRLETPHEKSVIIVLAPGQELTEAQKEAMDKKGAELFPWHKNNPKRGEYEHQSN